MKTTKFYIGKIPVIIWGAKSDKGYVKKNPVTRWNSPTYILYGGKDNLQSLQVIENFAKSNSVLLTISEQSEHSFMGNGDDKIIKSWICDNL